jgi:hypothetical protein
MSSTKATARLAGILYHGNATATTLLAIGTKENPLEAQTT